MSGPEQRARTWKGASLGCWGNSQEVSPSQGGGGGRSTQVAGPVGGAPSGVGIWRSRPRRKAPKPVLICLTPNQSKDHRLRDSIYVKIQNRQLCRDSK